jgi:hypothetical protein
MFFVNMIVKSLIALVILVTVTTFKIKTFKNKKTSRNKICLILWRRMEQYKRPKTLHPSNQFALQQALVLLELLLRHPGEDSAFSVTTLDGIIEPLLTFDIDNFIFKHCPFSWKRESRFVALFEWRFSWRFSFISFGFLQPLFFMMLSFMKSSFSFVLCQLRCRVSQQQLQQDQSLLQSKLMARTQRFWPLILLHTTPEN